MTNKIFLISENHPLFNQIKKKFDHVKEIDPVALHELNAHDFDEQDIIFDFTLFDRETKSELISILDQFSDAKVVSDLSIVWGEYLFHHHQNLFGGFSAAIYSPTNSTEVCLKSNELITETTAVFKELGLETELVTSPGIAFTYPRVISMIINEAYFSLEENLAKDSDIDKAMKYGVNYPMGPFEWGERIGLDKVCLILDELYAVTGDPRYRTSKALRLNT